LQITNLPICNHELLQDLAFDRDQAGGSVEEARRATNAIRVLR